jgi:hypothetical protein
MQQLASSAFGIVPRNRSMLSYCALAACVSRSLFYYVPFLVISITAMGVLKVAFDIYKPFQLCCLT